MASAKDAFKFNPFDIQSLFAERERRQGVRDQRTLDLQGQSRADQVADQAAQLKPILSQFGGATAQQIGGLLTSGSPQAEAIGGQQLQNVLAKQQGQEFIDQTPQAPLTRQQEATLRLQKQVASFSNLKAGVEMRNKNINDIGDDVRKTLKPVTEIVQAGADIENLLKSGTVLGGTAAAIRFAKASDPDSSVREGELGTIIGNLGGLEEEFKNAWNAAANKPLTERTASDLVRTTRALIAQRALDGLAQISGFSVIGKQAQIPEDQMQAIFQTARVNIPELVKFAAPAMTPQQAQFWKAQLSGQ